MHGVRQLHLPVDAVPLDEAHGVWTVEVGEDLPEVGTARVDLVEVACDAVLPAYGGRLVEPGDEPVGAFGGEDGLSRRPLLLTLAIESVHARVEPYAVRQHAVGVGPVLRRLVPIGEQLVRVPVAGAGKRRQAKTLDSGLTITEALSGVGIEAAEVEETPKANGASVAALEVG